MNLIGHSLGAHVSGFAGKNTDSKVAVIYGLDPAGVFFSHNNPDGRLAEDDAVETVVLHTNAGPLSLGFTEPIGTVDIYPNGGSSQPECTFSNHEMTDFYLIDPCSHSRAHQIFAHSINSDSFVASKCNSYNDAINENCDGPKVVFKGETGATVNYRGLYHFKTYSLLDWKF